MTDSSAYLAKNCDSDVTVKALGEEEIYKMWYECSGCGCNDILGHFSYCPGCGRRIVDKA